MKTRVDEPDTQERGSALIVTMIVLFILMSLAIAMVKNSTLQSQSTIESRYRAIATAECETGIALALRQVEKEKGVAPNAFKAFSGARALVTTNGTTTVDITEVDAVKKVVRVVATFVSARPVIQVKKVHVPYRLQIETYMKSSDNPAFYKAIYVGNKDGFPNHVNLGPSDGDSTTYTWDEAPFVDENTRLNEATLGIDFNGDGDLTDEPKISDIAAMTGWASFMENTGSTWRIDLNKNGVYTDTHSNTNPYSFAAPDGTETPDPSWESNHMTNGDYVEGDVYVKGDVSLRNDTTMWGNIDATGEVNGDIVPDPDTNVNEGAGEITPPDLQSVDYASLADETITPATVDSNRFYSASTSAGFYGGATSSQDNGIIHLGPASGGSQSNFTTAADNGKLILVKGNLWMHTSAGKKVTFPSGQDLVITIVVEGNLYIGDDLDYGNNTGVLFLVKGKADDPLTTGKENESFVDTNKNYVYDAGEPIINDDESGPNMGVYNGPKEGQGNIYFMDTAYGTGGVTSGFMYAENNAYVAPAVVSSAFSKPEDYIYGVNGFLSAGGVFSLADRSSGSKYINYKVKYDPRIENGTFNFKGKPTSSGTYVGLEVRSWRVIPLTALP